MIWYLIRNYVIILPENQRWLNKRGLNNNHHIRSETIELDQILINPPTHILFTKLMSRVGCVAVIQVDHTLFLFYQFLALKHSWSICCSLYNMFAPFPLMFVSKKKCSMGLFWIRVSGWKSLKKERLCSLRDLHLVSVKMNTACCTDSFEYPSTHTITFLPFCHCMRFWLGTVSERKDSHTERPAGNILHFIIQTVKVNCYDISLIIVPNSLPCKLFFFHFSMHVLSHWWLETENDCFVRKGDGYDLHMYCSCFPLFQIVALWSPNSSILMSPAMTGCSLSFAIA